MPADPRREEAEPALSIIKAAADRLALLLVLPCFLAYRAGSLLLLGPSRALPG